MSSATNRNTNFAEKERLDIPMLGAVFILKVTFKRRNYLYGHLVYGHYSDVNITIYTFFCSLLFIVRSLYEVRADHPAGCGDLGLTKDECNQALNVLGYNQDLTTHLWVDRPKGCVIGDTDGNGIYTDSYFNKFSGQEGAMFKSMCFKGIQIFSYGTVVD